jgi:hypothetical protein
MDKESYEFSIKILRIANNAVKKAQEENHRYGLPNVYSLNGKIVYQMPDGTVRDSYDFEMFSTMPRKVPDA